MFGEQERSRDQSDMNTQIGHAVVLVDQNQAYGECDKKQRLDQQRYTSAEADQKHDSGENKCRAQQAVECHQCELRSTMNSGEMK